MDLIAFLILFPLLPAVLLLFCRRSQLLTNLIVGVSVALISAAAIMLALKYTGGTATYFTLHGEHWNKLVLGGDILMALVFLFVCRKLPFKRFWIPMLVILQYGAVIAYEFSGRLKETERCLFVDNLSIVMALIIAVIGGLIAIYTPGYMKHYHHEHPGYKDRRNQFIAAIFLFFSAMFGIIFSTQITWIYFFWEITTLCSFIMIGYNCSPEAENNSFRALWMLLLGGLGFAATIIYCSEKLQTIDLFEVLKNPAGMIMIPILLICFAGMNKAAQFPFSSWLLGAMVAPTPSSALLHSSTMVKAGVYVVLRCSPALQDTLPGFIVAVIGGLTFLAGSAIGIAENDSKRILAYSTVANLGLIILCAGVGSPMTMWAAVLLIIFHALAKALLFLTVGVVDHQIGSRNVEDMQGLVLNMPKVAFTMLIGIAGMSLAPFGMLISKWAVLEALAKHDPLLPLAVIFGGTFMFFFWGKWLGMLVAVSSRPPRSNLEKGICFNEWTALWILTVLTISICGLFPWVANIFIEPMYDAGNFLSNSNVYTIIIMLGMLVLLIPPGILTHFKSPRDAEPYLGGANIYGDPTKFTNSLGGGTEWSLRSYYLQEIFGEKRLLAIANVMAVIALIAMFLSGAVYK
ncbi:MAG: hypothetical protein A2X49_03715 [Lentisphaerae bacterium GWF2_52_8]|nr:MAG: hypothetical protein A2X49_03715 [Lentisphaerae bacterium GWF2_52_8]